MSESNLFSNDCVDKNLIYSSKEMYAIAQISLSDESDSIFVTFNNRGDIYSGEDRFWGDTFFAKRNISVIGICARSASWFPEREMRSIAEIIVPLIKGRRVVTYGTSMGAYAAIRFSRLLGAKRVMAFSPQWSIVPEDTYPIETRYAQYYDSTQGGQSIRKDEVQGEIFLFFDPWEKIDFWHAQRIAEVADASDGRAIAHSILAPMTWHGSILHLTSSRGAIDLVLDLARKQDELINPSVFRQILRRSRNDSKYYQEIRFFFLAYRLADGNSSWIRELEHSCLCVNNQEARLILGAISCLRGEEKTGLDLVNKEITADMLHSTSAWSMDRVLRIVRIHGLKNMERAIRLCFLNRDPSNLSERFHFANALADIGYHDEAEASIITYFSERCDLIPEAEDRLLDLARKLSSSTLNAFLLHDRLLAKTQTIWALKGPPSSAVSSSLIVCFQDDDLNAPAPAFMLGLAREGVDTVRVVSPFRFPDLDMNEIAEAIKVYASGRPILCLGVYWGGYGALRHGDLLAAEAVIAFRAIDDQLMGNLAPTNAQMLSRAFVVYDPKERPDASIAKRWASTNRCALVPAPLMWSMPERALLSAEPATVREFAALLLAPNKITQVTLRSLIRRDRLNCPHYREVVTRIFIERFVRYPKFSAVLYYLLQNSSSPSNILIEAQLLHLSGREDEARRLLCKSMDGWSRDNAEDLLSLVTQFRKISWRAGCALVLVWARLNVPDIATMVEESILKDVNFAVNQIIDPQTKEFLLFSLM